MIRKVAYLIIAVLTVCISAAGQSFTFVQNDTLLTYSEGNQAYAFHGVVHNLLPEERTLIFKLTPVVFPDTGRWASICTWRGCYPPRSGDQSVGETYTSLQLDTAVQFDIYPTIDPGEESPITGNYSFMSSVYPSEHPEQSITYLMRLEEAQGVVTLRSSLLPNGHDVISNYPNPFNGETTISFTVSKAGPVSVSVFDVAGRHVTDLVAGTFLSAGQYSLHWNALSSGSNVLASGSYFVQIKLLDHVRAHRLLYVR
jgi:hypothetical protein